MAKDPDLSGKSEETGDYVGVKNKRGKIEYVGFDKFKVLVEYVKATKKQNAKNRKGTAYDAAIEEEFSGTETINKMNLHQEEVAGGFFKYPGFDGEPHYSLIEPAVTQPLQNDPYNWEITVDNKKMDQKNDKIFDFIKWSGVEDSDYSIKLTGIPLRVNKDGSLNLSYTLRGPGAGGRKSNEVDFIVKVDEPTQIDNVLSQVYKQGGTQGIEKLVNNMNFVRQAEIEGAGSYEMLGGMGADVIVENGSYNIYMTLEGGGKRRMNKEDINSKEQLGYQLAALNSILLQEMAMEVE